MSKGITYHIITVVAIFTALGLGIFIGSLLNGEKLLISQQNKLMTQLGENLKSVAQENNQLKDEITKLTSELNLKNQLVNCIFQDYVNGRLDGYNIAIITTGDKEIYGEITSLLQYAGANVLSITSITNLYEIDNMSVFRHIEPNENNLFTKHTNNIGTYVAKNLMYSILAGKNISFIEEMANMGYIDIQGDYSKMVDSIIWISPNKYGKEYVDLIDIPMLNIVKKLNIPSIIVEKSDSNYSAISAFKKLGFSTVDNIDTIYGKVSLLIVLKGVQGNFGIKDASNSLLPNFNIENYKQLNLKTNHY
ncbi:MAG: hypothetical protein PWP27_1411 [Clostridiales bacterium]|jgi:cell division protein FtsB|nr:hypothetical protein [Clostridiales bacterium]MDK2933601.1 hypothetical protein [Clostridiales bacterium]